MKDTYTAQAIIIRRGPFRERDSRVIVYTREQGKLELVARGTVSINSKLAAHIEPISVTSLMIIPGKRLNYIGGAIIEKSFKGVKNDLEKLAAVGRVVREFDYLVKPNLGDSKLYNLLLLFVKWLDTAKTADYNLFSYFYIFILISQLGYQPELYNCLSCKKRIQPGRNWFDYERGGVICGGCKRGQHSLLISDDSVKILRLALEEDFKKLEKIKIDKKLNNEIIKIISSFYEYHKT